MEPELNFTIIANLRPLTFDDESCSEAVHSMRIGSRTCVISDVFATDALETDRGVVFYESIDLGCFVTKESLTIFEPTKRDR